MTLTMPEELQIVGKMNRLNGSYTYLAGPIEYATKESSENWRDDFTKFAEELGIFVLNPLKKPTEGPKEDWDTRKIRKQALEMGNYDFVAKEMKWVRNHDLRLVDRSDFLVVRFDPAEKPFGTIEEIVTANRSKKPVLIHSVEGKKKASPWLFGMVPHEHIFGSMEKLKDYVFKVHTGEANHKRWVFIQIPFRIPA
jgi:nucleoside 2-deoxyribosyltransferase